MDRACRSKGRRGMHKGIVGMPEGKRLLGIPKRTSTNNNTKLYLGGRLEWMAVS
jgi:hypothetical protein